MPRGLPDVPVFTRNGKPMACIREGFEAARSKAEIEDFTFHDLRHTFVTNKRREGHHDFVIKKATGHKSTHTFRRYNPVSRDDLKGLVPGQSGKK